MIDLLASEEHKDLLRKTITGTIQSIPVPLFVPDADDDLQFTQPDHNDVADTRDRVDDEDDFIQAMKEIQMTTKCGKIIIAITIPITHLSQGRQGDPKVQTQDSAQCHSNRSAIGACRRRL